MRNLAVASLLGALAGIGCAHEPARSPAAHGSPGGQTSRVSQVSQVEWTRARAELAKMRDEVPREPYVELIRVALREPRTGSVIEGRGAVAVDPRRAMRLVLLGPGGRTALDVWVSSDAWRFSVPAIDMIRRGQADQPSSDVPVGFFRWWFLEPLDGRLLSIAPSRNGGRQFVLRDGKATVVLQSLPEVRERAHAAGRKSAAAEPQTSGWSALRHFVAVRREVADLSASLPEREMNVDRLEWIARGVHPGPGDRALYMQRATGLQVEIQVEALSDEAPDPAAFLDPDAQGLSL